MTKHFTNGIRLFSLLLITLIINISCKDHEVPEVLPVLKTLPIQQLRLVPPPEPTLYTNRYRLEVTEKGNVPVSRYGILFTTYSGAEFQHPESINKQPIVTTSINHDFAAPFELGERTLEEGPNYPLRTYVFQRAYAVLADGRVIYGDVVFTSNGEVTPIF